MQSAFQTIGVDRVPLGLCQIHNESHKHFSDPERKSQVWQISVPNVGYTKTQSNACDIHACSVTVSPRVRSLSEIFEEGVEWKSIISAAVLVV
jgi:hypothetical protein